MRIFTLSTLLLLLTLSPALHAQNLYSLDGVEYETLSGTTDPSILGIGNNGYVYVQHTADGIYFPFACYHVDDPEGTRRVPEFPVGAYLTAMTWDSSGLAYLYWDTGKRHFGVFRCGDGPDFPDGYTIEDSDNLPLNLPILSSNLNSNYPQGLVMAPDGAFCFKTTTGLRCGMPEPGEELADLPLIISMEQIDTDLAVDPGLAESVVFGNVLEIPKRIWELRDILWTPDGRLFSLVALRFSSVASDGDQESTDWMPYLLEHHEDGTFDVWSAPPRPPAPGPKWMAGDKHVSYYNPLFYAEQLVYSDQLDAVLAWPVVYMEYMSETYKQGTMIYPGAPGGVGFYVFPFSGDHAGYLSAKHGRLNGILQWMDSSDELAKLPDQQIGVRFFTDQGYWHRLLLDLDVLDMDTDGLSYNEELALGMSDYTISSDGSTTADSIEVVLKETDPTDFNDDPAFWRPGRFTYVESGLIRKLFDDYGLTDIVSQGLQAGTSALGPLCTQKYADEMVCILKDRVSRVVAPVPSKAPRKFDHDGRTVAYMTDDAIKRFFFEDGRVETMVTIENLALTLGTDRVYDEFTVDFYPAKDAVYVSYYKSMSVGAEAWEEFFVAYFDADEPGVLLYDHQKARCDSGLGHCDPTWDLDPGSYMQHQHDLLYLGIGVVGYLPELDRLIIKTAGRWGRYLVSLRPGEEPTVLIGPQYLQGGGELYGMPGPIQRTGYGDYFTGFGFIDGWLNARNNSKIQGMGGGNPTAFFWDNMASNFYTSDGLWELVRYEGWGDPGDVLLATHAGNDYGYMIYRSGPRGGLADGLIEPHDLPDVWGIDVRDDGLLCLADRLMDNGSVYIFQQEVPDSVAADMVMVAGDLGDVRDCHWDKDGSLYWVTQNPPRIWHLPELWVENFELFQELPTQTEPLALVEAPDGTLEVLDANGAERGFYYLSDGRRLSMPIDSWWVQVDGVDLVQLNQLMWGQMGVAPGNHSSCFVRFQERPDGLVVAVPMASEAPPPLGGRGWVFNPDTGEAWPLSSNQIYPHYGNGLAILPGGIASDPWGPAGIALAPEGPAGPEAPPAQTVGFAVMREGGCSVAPNGNSATPFLLLGLLLLSLLAIRARRLPGPLLLCLLVFATACGGSDESTGDGINEPASETNVEPLAPMQVGSRTVVLFQGELLHRVVAEKITVNGKESRRVDWSDGTVNTWQHTSEGWAISATQEEELDSPLLMVPDKVHVGKSWNSGAYFFEVTARGMELTPWGKRMSWQIMRIGPLGLKFRYYAEGRGWYKDTGYEEKEIFASFMPLVAPTTEPPDIGKSSLEPLLGSDGEQLVLGFEGAPRFMVQEDMATATMGAFGQSWAFLSSTWVLISSAECLRFENGTVKTITSSGKGLFEKSTHAQCYSGGTGGGVGDPDFSHFNPPPWRSSTGEFHYVKGDQLGADEYLAPMGQEDDASPELLVLYGATVRAAPWGNTAFESMPSYRAVIDPLLALTHFDPQFDKRISPMYSKDNEIPLGQFTNSGVLVESRYLDGLELTRAVPKFYAGFGPIVTTTTVDHRALITSSTTVDEVRYVGDEPIIERVVRFSLPKNHFPTGAVRLGNQIILTTGNRIDGADPYNNKDARVTYFWSIEAPLGSGTPFEPPPSLAVSAQVSGADVVVCWPETDSPLETQGWTLGGGTPLAVLQINDEGNCVVLVRDFEASTDIWVEGGGIVEGPVPGVGRMEIVVPRGTVALGYDTVYHYGASPTQLWPTPDGGFIGLGKVFNELGLPQFLGPNDLRDKAGVTTTAGAQDAAGNGFWVVRDGYVDLHTSEGEVITSQQGWVDGIGKGKQVELQGPVAGGGVIMRTPIDGSWAIFKIGLDGSVTRLPDGPEETHLYGFTSVVEGAQGDLCGTTGLNGLYCHDGTQWNLLEDGPEGLGSGHMLPLVDGSILVLIGELGWKLDPTNMVLEEFSPGTHFSGQFKYDPDGNLFFLREDFDVGWGGRYQVVEGAWPMAVTPDGVTPLVLPDTSLHGGFQGSVAGIVPTSDFFFIYLDNDNFMRVPR